VAPFQAELLVAKPRRPRLRPVGFCPAPPEKPFQLALFQLDLAHVEASRTVVPAGVAAVGACWCRAAPEVLAA
jgi:hypothetical protein